MALYPEMRQWLTPTQTNPLVQRWGDQAAAAAGRTAGLLPRAALYSAEGGSAAAAAPRGLSYDPGAAARWRSQAQNQARVGLAQKAASYYGPLREQELKLRNAAEGVQTTSPEAAFLGGFTQQGGWQAALPLAGRAWDWVSNNLL